MLKSYGVTRKVDHLGRITIPVGIRKALHVKEFDSVEMFVDGEDFVLRKYKEHCVFCSNREDLLDFKEKKICPDCKENIIGKLILKII
jgi:transcriptional pleiotropic regulator of transition state genes